MFNMDLKNLLININYYPLSTQINLIIKEITKKLIKTIIRFSFEGFLLFKKNI